MTFVVRWTGCDLGVSFDFFVFGFYVVLIIMLFRLLSCLILLLL